MSEILYRINTATPEDIYLHLEECQYNFVPPLNARVDIKEYSEKISAKAVTFEAWDDKILAGLLAAYFNDDEKISGFITNVSTLKRYQGKGIAAELVKKMHRVFKERWL